MQSEKSLYYKIHELDEQAEISCPVGHIISNQPVYQHIMTCLDLKQGLTKIYYLCQFQNYHILNSLDEIIYHQNNCTYNFEKLKFDQKSEFFKIMISGDDSLEGIQKYEQMVKDYQLQRLQQLQEKSHSIKYIRTKILDQLREIEEVQNKVSFNVNQFTILFKGIRIDSQIYKLKLYRNYYQEKKFKQDRILIKDFNNFYDCRGLILDYLKLIKTEQDYYKYMVAEFIIPQKYKAKFNENFKDIYKFAAAGLMSSEVLIIAHRKNLIVQNYIIGDCAVLIFSKLTETSQFIICKVKTDPEEITVMDTLQLQMEEKRKKDILIEHQKRKQEERDKVINGYYQNIRKLEDQIELIQSQINRNRDNILDRTSILKNNKKRLQNSIHGAENELDKLEESIYYKRQIIEEQKKNSGRSQDEAQYRKEVQAELIKELQKFEYDLSQLPAFREVFSQEEFTRRQALFHSTVERNLELEKRIKKQEFQIEILETIVAQEQNIVIKQEQKINQMTYDYDYEIYKKRKCQVCLERNASYVNIPCGCTIYCGRCLLLVTQNQLDQICVQCGNVVRSQIQMDF